jgi:diguanylate cyclase (GGDEF)-like protein
MEIALARKDAIIIENMEEFEKEYSIAPLQRRFKAKYSTGSCISSPLVVGGEKSRFVVGVINFSDRSDGQPFDEANDVATVRQLSQFLAIAIKNCRLFNEVQQQARQDSLTRLYNYRGFHETLLSEIHRAMRYSRPLTLLMYDIDNFKQINDKHGHQAGDYVLSEMGKIFRRFVRREDLPARYGGDEISVILPETELVGAQIISSRLKDMITSHEFTFNGNKMVVTVSCGVAQYRSNQSLSDFINAADHALYEAKQNGKNNIVMAP